MKWFLGNYRQVCWFLGMVVILGRAVCSSPVSAQEQAVQPTRSLPGGLVAFFSTGFIPGEWVVYWVHEPAACVEAKGSVEACVREGGQVRANDDGRADWTWKIPEQARYGTWTMVAQGKRSSEQRTITFEVTEHVPDFFFETPAGQLPRDAAVVPAVGAPGTVFSVFALGYRKDERVRFWAFDPLNRLHYLGSFGTNRRGRVDWQWETDRETLPGRWVLLMRGEKSQVERVVQVTISETESFPEKATPRDLYDQAVSPLSGPPRTFFSFFASNFQSYERVTYRIVDPTGIEHLRGEKHATKGGRVDLEWKAPPGAPPGLWQWIAEGESGDQRTLTFTITPDWTETIEPASKPYVRDFAVVPGRGKPGTEFSFFATGFASKEPVAYQCVDAEGILDSQGLARANTQGRVDWSCKTNSQATFGEWKTIVQGRKSLVQRTISFTVTQP